jgi:negative regulator of sigma E activity
MQMSIQARETGYRGKKVIIDFSMRVPKITNYDVIHMNQDLEKKEYPEQGRVVIKKDGYLWRYYPGKGLAVKKKAPTSGGWDTLQKENLDLVMKNYYVETSGAGKILGRPAILVHFTPLRKGTRPSRKVWIDKDKGLPLRTEIYGVDGQLYMISHFEKINYDSAVEEGTFDIKEPKTRIIQAEEEVEICQVETGELAGKGGSWGPTHLPQGFVVKCLRKMRSRDNEEYQHMYTDGLSALSFFESSNERKLASQESEMTPVDVGSVPGEIHDFGLLKIVKWRSNGSHFILIGELDPEGLLEVADSVEKRAPGVTTN